MEEFTSQKKGLFELDNYISSIRCSPESGKHIDELERIEQMM